MLFLCHKNEFCISIVFSFSRGHFNSQEKLKTMLMQNFGWQTKSIMVCYGIFWSGQFSANVITIHDRTCLAVSWNSPPNPFTPTGSCFILLLDCRSQYSFFCTCENNILTLEGCFLWHIRQLGFSVIPGEKRWQSLCNQWLWHLVWVWVWNNHLSLKEFQTTEISHIDWSLPLSLNDAGKDLFSYWKKFMQVTLSLAWKQGRTRRNI